MNLELAEKLITAEPFVPLQLFPTDGRAITISNVELISIAADSRSLAVVDHPHVEYIDFEQIVSVRVSNLQA